MDNELYRVCIDELTMRGEAIRHIPNEFLTEELCFTALEHSKMDYVLSYFPYSCFTDRIIDMAVTKYHNALMYIPKERLTEEICRKAVEVFPTSFEYIPADLFTDSLIELAVRGYGYNLKYISESKRSRDLCMTAFSDCEGAIRYIPECFITNEMCVEAVTKCVPLAFIPPKMRTVEICFIALKDNSRYVSIDVPKDISSEVGKKLYEHWRIKDEKAKAYSVLVHEICENPFTIKKFTQEQRQDSMLCALAVQQEGMLLRFVHKNLRDEKMCLYAVENDIEALAYVPEELKPVIIDKVRSGTSKLRFLFSESDCRDLFL